MYLDETLVAYVRAYYPTATITDIKRVYNYAQHKLFTIIEREGDGDGRRLEYKYFAHLIAEQLRADDYAKRAMNKMKEPAEADSPKTVSLFYHNDYENARRNF